MFEPETIAKLQIVHLDADYADKSGTDSGSG